MIPWVIAMDTELTFHLLFILAVLCTTLKLAVEEPPPPVTVDIGQECGNTLSVGASIQAFRLMPPSPKTSAEILQANSSFNCTIHVRRAEFSFLKRSGSICVDFSRLRLKGDSTKVKIYSDAEYFSFEWTSTNYPLLGQSLATKVCYQSHRNVTLHFESPHSDDLRQFFTSWVYIYNQEDEHIIYLDGTCYHRQNIYRYDKVTVRSYVWHDTALEPVTQNCVLQFTPDTHLAGLDETSHLCQQWHFFGKFCEMSAITTTLWYVNKYEPSLQGEDKQTVTCNNITDVNPNFCVNMNYVNHPAVAVKRVRTSHNASWPPDGSMFVELKASNKIEQLERGYYPSDSDSDNPEDTFTIEPEHIIVPVIIVVAVGMCCYCIFHREWGKRQSTQSSSSVTRVGYLSSRNLANDLHLQPLTDGAESRPNRDNEDLSRQLRSGRSADDLVERSRMSLPPPNYSEVTAGPEQHGDVLSNDPSAEEEMPLSPPPFTDSQPPAYHELFPAQT